MAVPLIGYLPSALVIHNFFSSKYTKVHPRPLIQSIPQVGMGSYVHLQIAEETVKAAAFNL